MASRSGPNGKCRVCRHVERARVEYLLAAGATLGAVARRFGLSKDSTWRHWTRHVDADRRLAIVAGSMKLNELALRAADEGESLLDHFAALRAIVYNQIVIAAEVGDRHQVAALSGRAVEILNALGRLNGTLIRGASIHIENNFVLNSAFVELQRMLLLELAPYPEARAAVVAGLRRLERQAAPRGQIEGAADAVA